MHFKALLLDVDGTVVPVGPHTKPSKRVETALKEAHTHVPVCIVSGRSLEWLEELFEILDLTHPCIINGGSQIIDPQTKRILWERPIAPTSMREIMTIVDKGGLTFIVSDDGLEEENPSRRDFKKPLNVKLTYFGSKADSDRCAQVLTRIPDVAVHKVVSWDKERAYKLEIYTTHAEATKEHAAIELAHLLGIEPEHMVGVGDARNDIPLLAACGLKVAMGNADAKLKAMADLVVSSVEEDGVAEIARHFIYPESAGYPDHAMPQSLRQSRLQPA